MIADGPCTDRGELALGRNVLVAFMPWRGYNFEDAILVSERLVKEDYYTSIHIEELEIEARDTKLGPEEITRDIPNVGENMLRDLDESGIIRIGAQVKPGSILVGKVTPKGETQLTAEEKLLRAIFGEKAGDVKDASLVCPPGIDGTVVDVQVFTRKGQEKDQRSLAIEQEEEDRLRRDLEDEIRILREQRDERIYELLEGRKLSADLTVNREVVIPKNVTITREMLEGVEPKALRKVQTRFFACRCRRRDQGIRRSHRTADQDPLGHLRREDRQAAAGRRACAGRDQDGQGLHRHEAQAFSRRQDGRTSRKQGRHRAHPAGRRHALPAGRNAGRDRAQSAGRAFAYERGPDSGNAPWLGRARSGFALRDAGFRRRDRSRDQAEAASWPAHALRELGLPEIVNESGKAILYDGLSGDPFEQKVTVGYIYMLKLSHLVDDKIHARSIGPYSLITQQPLGGKAQFGGQRFGEMEVWALEAYGAAHILQELLTAKSDDVAGRSKIYEAIVKGEADFDPGLPESFNVLVRELQSLCLDVELINKKVAGDGAGLKKALAKRSITSAVEA